MTLEKNLVSEISIDIDIAMMTTKRCNKGEVKTPSLLRLEDTKENLNIVERYIFWNVIWKSLSNLGWILDKDGNFESEFIALSPLDPICNSMKKNMDFFDDEAELMMAISTDPRLIVIKELAELRALFNDYLVQFKLLKAMFADAKQALPGNLPWDLESNKNMLKYLESRVRDNHQKKQMDRMRDEKETLLIQSIIAEQDRRQDLHSKITTSFPADQRARKRMHREMIISEYERRKRLNGGRFPVDKQHPTPPSMLLGEAKIRSAKTIPGYEQQQEAELKIRDAIATACQPPPLSLKPRIVSVTSLQEQLQQQQRQQQQRQHQLSPRMALQNLPGFPRAAASIEIEFGGNNNNNNRSNITGNIANMTGRIVNQPRRISLSSSNNSAALSPIQHVDYSKTNSKANSLKLSWDEIQSAYFDLKGPKAPARLDMNKINDPDSFTGTLGSSSKRLRLF